MKLTTNQAAEKLKVGLRQIQKLINDGRLPAEKIGRDWLIEEKDLNLEAVRVRNKTGRPKKSAEK